MSKMTRQEIVTKMTKRAEETLRQFGVGQIAEEFVKMYENYRELAAHATKDQYEDIWTHDQLMKFLQDGEF
tara:strand:- start:253 stop:465 length:213 start_codon:yes stop_codon:yes gene_type:complete